VRDRGLLLLLLQSENLLLLLFSVIGDFSAKPFFSKCCFVCSVRRVRVRVQDDDGSQFFFSSNFSPGNKRIRSLEARGRGNWTHLSRANSREEKEFSTNMGEVAVLALAVALAVALTVAMAGWISNFTSHGHICMGLC